ncbi:MAG: Bax inhibitor-1 family protein [Patescibacteria group bacterium]
MKTGEGIHTGVFERTGGDEMSSNAFFALLGMILIWGIGFTALSAHLVIEAGYKPGLWEALFFGLVLPIIGICIAMASGNAFISFIGYNLIVIPYGVVLGPYVQLYSPDAVRNALLITMGVTAFMSVLGLLLPDVFRHLGGALFVALCGLLVIRIIQIFVPSMQSWGAIDYAAAGLFALYIGYDMHRASEIAKTTDNAVDVAVDLYLDILNLFINILKIAGKKND